MNKSILFLSLIAISSTFAGHSDIQPTKEQKIASLALLATATEITQKPESAQTRTVRRNLFPDNNNQNHHNHYPNYYFLGFQPLPNN